ncbi:uncharacterized protein At4g26485-like [Lotus japonicus]|uniref:uncharacterized protein At4g26485-like n=1 Tax=Lotus japonicus TaxID=34305 RepID=UPI00258E3336|nr:uncharacterized protein At4g26485-like [Lotus japonicus]
MDSQREEKWIKHYSSHHKILLVGEGDFSFALCLAKAFGSASNMVATSLNSEGFLIVEYSRASANLKELEDLGCTIIHEVNAKSMNTHPLLEMKLFDRIIFNFPHAGFFCREDDRSQIMLHQIVVFRFMKSARKMVTQDGEIHVTHKDGHPYNRWEIVKLGEKARLSLVEKVPFMITEYPGYVNRRGSGDKCGQSFLVGLSSTFKFSKKTTKQSEIVGWIWWW